ncbi:MAG TPA: Ig-like domain-containing protein [Gemmatimonadales bacterium]|nr:Ig-like domain-containing protein [Gemmatimonadales bacterium]
MRRTAGKPFVRPSLPAIALAGALALAAVAITGCKAGEVVDPTPPGLISVASLTVSTARDTLFVSDTLRLRAESRDSSGKLLGGRVVTWSSSAPAVAMVAPNGVVTAVSPGRTTIKAASGGQSATADFTVIRIVFKVNVVPDAVCLRQGFSTVLTLTAFDSLGQPLPAGLRPIDWRTSDAQTVTVTPQSGDSALVLGIQAGKAIVTGILMGVADTTSLLVDPTPIGEPLHCGQ